jgi:hypothetical protein
MEYAYNIQGVICNDDYNRYVGYQDTNACVQKYFSKDTVDIISHKATELLMGVDPQNRPIIIPDKTICAVMSAVYSTYSPETGDIYTRYNIPSGQGPQSYTQNMVDQVLEIIVSDVSNNLGMEENNSKLSIWTTVYGDFNKHKLRQHAPIKVRNKRPNPMEFQMNY